MGQLISELEAGTRSARDVLPALYGAGGRAHVIGVTGPAGSGKSTLVAAFATELRGRGRTVGIVAVDPSSSISGGAILGDRIRMQQHTLDPGIFMRSMSTRGRLGGISRATFDAVAVLDAAGCDCVIVETVGVGQAEVEIVRIAHTTLVVSVPGLGDDIQAIKAGLLEIADLHVVNKADRPDANRTVAELLGMLALASPGAEGGWAPPVLTTNALDGTGVPELADTVERHMDHLRRSGELADRERVIAAARIQSIIDHLVAQRLRDPAAGAGFDGFVRDVAARRLDPHSAALELIRSVAQPDTDWESTA
jgi:LAO/AO transport system kinase